MTRRHLLLAFQVGVTAALLFWLFRNFDWNGLRLIAGRLSGGFFAASFAVIAAGQMLYAWRWKAILDGLGARIPFADVLRQYLVGLLFSNIMPTAVGGDAAKVYYVGRRIGYSEAVGSVVADRFLGFFWLAALGASLSWITGANTTWLILNRNVLTVVALGFTVALTLIWTVPAERLVPDALRRGPLAKMVAMLEGLAVHVRSGCRPTILLVAGIVVCSYVLLLGMVYRGFFASVGLGTPALLPTMNVIVSMSVFVNLPVSVGGVGLREQLHYMLFSELGIPKEASISLSLLVYAYTLVISMAGYVIWLRMKRSLPAVAS